MECQPLHLQEIDAILFLDQKENGESRSKEYYEITPFVQTTGASKFCNNIYVYNKRISTYTHYQNNVNFI